MTRVERSVFISYRRTNVSWALAIYQNLTHHGYDVFFDFKGIGSGDFESVILANISARAHFVVLLAPSALERCNDPNDWLRREIQAALGSKRNIVPLMLEGFDFDSPGIGTQLTGTLAELRRYNALRVPMDYFDEAMDRMRRTYLDVPLDAVLHPAPPSVREAVEQQQRAANEAPAVTEEELTELERLEQRILELGPVFDLNTRGHERLGEGDFAGAIAEFNKALQLRPDSGHTYSYRGQARMRQGDLDGALHDFDTALQLDPELDHAYRYRGGARMSTGDLHGALQDFNEALKRNPYFDDSYHGRGILREEEGDLEGAVQDFDEAIRLAPNVAHNYINRGLVVDKLGTDPGAAMRDFDEAVRLEPNLNGVHLTRGVARLRRGDVAGALRDFDEELRRYPGDVDALELRQAVLKEMDQGR